MKINLIHTPYHKFLCIEFQEKNEEMKIINDILEYMKHIFRTLDLIHDRHL